MSIPAARLRKLGSNLPRTRPTEGASANHPARAAVIDAGAQTDEASEAGEWAYLAAKRLLDVALVLTALVVLSPLLLLIALAIKLEDRGPMFFCQTRVGKGGRTFRFWKFRSMSVDAEAKREALKQQTGQLRFKMEDDPRVTRTGRLLRRFSLDELPQLYNVLRGDMTLVGPRPPLPEEVAEYTPRQRGRLTVDQGITCTWQVSGRSLIPFEEQVELDLDYIENRSLSHDLRLLLLTVPAVITGRGAC